MQNEIVKLLKKEGKLSEKTIDEISNIEIGDFSDLVRELGKEETEHRKNVSNFRKLKKLEKCKKNLKNCLHFVDHNATIQCGRACTCV